MDVCGVWNFHLNDSIVLLMVLEKITHQASCVFTDYVSRNEFQKFSFVSCNNIIQV